MLAYDQPTQVLRFSSLSVFVKTDQLYLYSVGSSAQFSWYYFLSDRADCGRMNSITTSPLPVPMDAGSTSGGDGTRAG